MEVKRKQQRVPLSNRGTIRAAGGGSRVPVRLLDIAIDSVNVSYHSPLKIGSAFEIELALFIDGVLNPMRLHGKVFETHLSHDEFRSQIKFVDLKPGCATTIHQFLKYRLKQP